MEKKFEINGVKVVFFTSLENGNNAFSFRAITSEADANYDLVEAEKPYTMNDIMYRGGYVAYDEYYVSFSDFITFCVKNNVFDNETAAAIMEAWSNFINKAKGTNTEMEEKKMDKNLEHVQNIVKDMADFASGSYFIYDGDLFPIDRDEFAKENGCKIRQENVCGDIHTFYVMPDGGKIFEGDLEIATIGDYFNDFYDVDYIVGSDKKYKACRVLVAFGGPKIYIDTWDGQVQLEWWGEHAEAYIPDDLCGAIDEFFEMLYEC